MNPKIQPITDTDEFKTKCFICYTDTTAWKLICEKCITDKLGGRKCKKCWFLSCPGDICKALMKIKCDCECSCHNKEGRGFPVDNENFDYEDDKYISFGSFWIESPFIKLDKTQVYKALLHKAQDCDLPNLHNCIHPYIIGWFKRKEKYFHSEKRGIEQDIKGYRTHYYVDKGNTNYFFLVKLDIKRERIVLYKIKRIDLMYNESQKNYIARALYNEVNIIYECFIENIKLVVEILKVLETNKLNSIIVSDFFENKTKIYFNRRRIYESK